MSGSLSQLPPQVLAMLMQRMQGGQGGAPSGMGGAAPGGMPQPGMQTPMSGYQPPMGMQGGATRPMMAGGGAAPAQPPSFGQAFGSASGGTAPLMALLAQMKQGQSGVSAPNGMGGANPGAAANAQFGQANPGFQQWAQQAYGGQTPPMNPATAQWLQSAYGTAQQAPQS